MSEAKFSILKPGDCRDDEELCVASVSDREAVMAIEPAAFAGYDYLPTTYHEFVAGPGVTGYVYKKRGKVAGFLSTLLVDGGQTITTSAGRVCMELRGEGMYGRFTRRVFERSLDMYPDLRYIAMSTDNLNWDINGNKLRNAYDVLEEMDLLFFQLNPAEARQRTPRKASQIPGIRRLTWDDMNTVMKDCPRDLFPCGRIMIIRYSYGIMEANTDLIYRQWDKPVFMGSFHEPASEGEGRHTPYLLSCGSYWQCSRGLVYQTCVYGTGSDETMRAHLEWHLLRLVDVAGAGDAFMIIKSPVNVSNIVESLRAELSITDLPVGYNKAFGLGMELRR
ncbi:hypothetical protein BaRGS_00008306 [Batillaria attramentaria]|uniref:GNAT family N-acetyltransferase n=1 Tax=Batillaria attramentaria TaxID=370345 RepID=A0ABD0LLX1_9CAEN